MATPQVGDAVLYEGQPSRILKIVGDKVEFVSDLRHTREDGTVVPRFGTIAFLADMLWSSRLSAWYLWGRVLGKGRGGVGEDQRRVAIELRDRGVVPSRLTRQLGQAPAAGEHHGLYCDLFHAKEVDWKQEMRNVSLDEGLSDNAKAACAEHRAGFKTKRLNHGFADRDDGDPGFDQFVAATGKGN